MPASALHQFLTPLCSPLSSLHFTGSVDLQLPPRNTSAMARPLRSFCLHRIRSAGAGASGAASTAAPPSICGANKEAGSSDDGGDSKSVNKDEEVKKKGGNNGNEAAAAAAVVVGRKVMVAADGGSEEARTALQWALSHAVRPCDTLVVLDVVRGSGGAGGNGKNRREDPRGCQHLEAMRSICQAKRPEVRVELSVAEGKDRGPAIVEAARKQGVSLLVVGQRKRSVAWRLLSMWMAGVSKGAAAGGSATDYCVQHAACMALAVRRKSRRGGGYLITTRRQRDFWLLA